MPNTGFLRAGTTNVAEGEVIDATTGAGFVGAVTVYVSVDGATPVLGTVGGGAAIAQGGGWFKYLPSAAESDGVKCSFQFRGVGGVSALAQYYTISAAQAQALQAATGTGVVPVSTIVSDAFIELNVFGASQSQDPGDMAFGLGKLNRLFDNLNAMRQGVYQQQFLQFTLTPALSPHTIGPTGTWVTIQRPVTIDGADLAVGSGVTQPIDFEHDWEWYQDISLQGQTSAYPTDAYYQPSWPNGAIYFWPVPSSARVVTLSVRIALAMVTLVDTFWMPPGYRDAVTLTLAESMMSAYPRANRDDGKLARAALLSRDRVYANNLIIPKLTTVDSGMPSAQGGLMNWRTRQVTR